MPYKSVAIALLFSAILGPVGLLYASFWGGFALILVAVYVVGHRLISLAVLVWIVSCLWSVRAVESYNKKLLKRVS